MVSGIYVFFFKQKTAYEMRISDWSSDVCSSDLTATLGVDGTIIVAPSVLTNDQTIAGGFLTGAAGGGLVGVQQNGGGTFTIASTIIDNGADVIGFTKGGTGIVRLSGANTYTGATTLSGGRLEVTKIGRAHV